MKKILLIAILFFCQFINAQVGINTPNPQSTLDVNGNLSVKHISLIGSSSITMIDDGTYVSVDPRATDQEFKLPSPVLYPGRMYFLRNINDTFTAKLTTVAGNFFTRGLTTGGTNTIFMFNNNNRSIIVISDGLNWTIF